MAEIPVRFIESMDFPVHLKPFLRAAVTLFLLLMTLGITVWSCLSLWFRAPGPEVVRTALALAFGLVGMFTLYGLARGRRRMLIVLLLFFILDLAWWSTIEPSRDLDFSADVSRQVTGTITGNRLVLRDVRDFDWTSETDFKPNWVIRDYDLDHLRTLDLFMAYWAGPEMAHVIFSFGFDDGRYLAWSIEVRRLQGGEFSPIADLFKRNPLVIIASEERDVVRLRSNIRGENVQLYRLNTPPEITRKILLGYVSQANDLAEHPRFYNSLVTNCTTTIVTLIRSLGIMIPLDWRLIVNGYLPDYAYEIGAIDQHLPLAEVKRAALITERAKQARPEDFSTAIRVGIPSPDR